eukprot:CAMPEP_0182472806 /NCGR_PEP_ID=MMETSP1319-20130603/22878_1 /TAXON_ID=172717 /ORGANISM="Bolidomonas pacifica, Strain RCC208" /LENGTH=64 /DNA_ID=CAMNT_0024673545 /DNA_START=49 /DNA_END=239 /DNA_ORIENTATION=+
MPAHRNVNKVPNPKNNEAITAKGNSLANDIVFAVDVICKLKKLAINDRPIPTRITARVPNISGS